MTENKEFKKPSVTADVIIEDKGEIYLIQRKFEPYKDCWALPGGFLDVDKEEAKQTAKREAKEETGLDIELEDLQLFHETSDPNKNERGHIVSLFYVATKCSGVAKPGDDAADVKKFTLSNLPQMAFDHKEIIERYKTLNGKKHFRNPGATASMIVEREGKICYVKRKSEPYRGMLALPGGFLEYKQECLEQTAARELKEETNLKASKNNLELLMVNSSPTRDPRDHVIDHIYIVKKYSGIPKAGDDAEELYWIPIGEEPKLAFDHNLVIEKYKIWRKNRK